MWIKTDSGGLCNLENVAEIDISKDVMGNQDWRVRAHWAALGNESGNWTDLARCRERDEAVEVVAAIESGIINKLTILDMPRVVVK